MSSKSILILGIASILLTVFACEEPLPPEEPASGSFRVTIENLFEKKQYLDSGTFIRIDSADVVTFNINAGIGQRLSLITSLNDTSDIFIATPSDGIPLFVGNEQFTGNITDQFDLYDAGTYIHEYITILDSLFEFNQETMEMDTIIVRDTTYSVTETIDFLPSDSLPDLNSSFDIQIDTIGNATGFEVTITNKKPTTNLLRSISEGAWVVHDAGEMPFYQVSTFAGPELMDQAQSNINSGFRDVLRENTGWFSTLSPGAYAINDSLFNIGTAASGAMELLAENGDPSGFENVFDTPNGSSQPGMISTGESYSFLIDGTAGDYFSMASMLLETNDWYVGAQFIPLFQNNKPLTGEITS